MNLTEGEKAMINRRRMQMTQADVAALHGVPQSKVSEWENGKGMPPMAMRRNPLPLTELEELRLLRKHIGLTIEEVADKLGVSHVTVIAMEKGRRDPEPLVRLINDTMAR